MATSCSEWESCRTRTHDRNPLLRNGFQTLHTHTKIKQGSGGRWNKGKPGWRARPVKRKRAWRNRHTRVPGWGWPWSGLCGFPDRSGLPDQSGMRGLPDRSGLRGLPERWAPGTERNAWAHGTERALERTVGSRNGAGSGADSVGSRNGAGSGADSAGSRERSGLWSGLCWLPERSGLWSGLCRLPERSGLWSGLCRLPERSGPWSGMRGLKFMQFCFFMLGSIFTFSASSI